MDGRSCVTCITNGVKKIGIFSIIDPLNPNKIPKIKYCKEHAIEGCTNLNKLCFKRTKERVLREIDWEKSGLNELARKTLEKPYDRNISMLCHGCLNEGKFTTAIAYDPKDKTCNALSMKIKSDFVPIRSCGTHKTSAHIRNKKINTN